MSLTRGPAQRPHKATASEMAAFHSADYVDFLRRITPETAKQVAAQMTKCAAARHGVGLRGAHRARAPADNIGEFTDCPVFDGMFDFCQLYTGASLGAHERVCPPRLTARPFRVSPRAQTEQCG